MRRNERSRETNMKECNCRSASTSTGIRRIRAEVGGIPTSGEHTLVSIQLNSIHIRADVGWYAFTVRALEVDGGELMSEITFSAYATSKPKQHLTEQGIDLWIVSGNKSFPIEQIKVWITKNESIRVYSETLDGRLVSHFKKVDLLRLKAKFMVYGKEFVPEARYSIPDCPPPYELYVDTKCIHDECGPSWRHFPCNYRCLARTCCTNGECGSWTDFEDGFCGVHCF